MRIVLLVAVLLSTASCVMPPLQQGAYCPWARQALAAGAPATAAGSPAAAAVVAAPPPSPAPQSNAAPTAGTPVAYQPWPPLFRFGPPPVGRLTLSNFTFDLVNMEALVTPYPDCALHPGIVPRDFKLPLNATWIIPTPPGSDVCWRHLVPGAPPARAEWNRAFTAAGHLIDARL